MSFSAKKIVTVFLLAVCLFLFAFIGYFIFVKQQEIKEERAEREKIMAVEVNNPDMPEEYREFKANNPDVYGWIAIEGTEISTPIVQSQENNSFYLTHDALKNESDSGAVFSENYNSLDFTDFLTVLYGNSMERGGAFADLLEYEDPVYFSEHRNIKVILPDKTLNYYIFASYTGDNSHLLLTRDLSKNDNRTRYISSIWKQRGLKNNLDKTVEVNTDSRILALSTSHPSNPDARFIIQAVLI